MEDENGQRPYGAEYDAMWPDRLEYEDVPMGFPLTNGEQFLEYYIHATIAADHARAADADLASRRSARRTNVNDEGKPNPACLASPWKWARLMASSFL